MSIRLVCARRLADSYEMDAIIHVQVCLHSHANSFGRL